jgi:hypothetical protein
MLFCDGPFNLCRAALSLLAYCYYYVQDYVQASLNYLCKTGIYEKVTLRTSIRL